VANPSSLLLLYGCDNTGALLCGPNLPCADGSCCGKASGICGYGAEFCGTGNCTSNCDAKAMCGRDSDLGGTIKCGMNLCCAYSGWCGTTEGHCGNPDPNGLAPCQEGFGLYITRRPTHAIASANKVTPAQINTTGYTHLNFAFAAFSPKTWEVVPASPDDVALYTQFTSLKRTGLETWIAIGGFDFSDPGTATHTAWSDMTASAAARKAFIASVMSFRDKYGFQGVDLDWEYPGSPERGGQRADTQNLVLLVKEMRAAFGTKYGISMAIAPDYWYLRWFDPAAMQDSVDWFGFMSYDLHGSWDADVKTLGSIVRGQTDIQEISNNTLPLWYDGLDPAKINFGVAYYGRGYTLSSSTCTDLGCPFAGPSKPAACTNSYGVMSAREIQNIIKEKKLTPKLLQPSMMKQITWEGQWMGYDDDETIAMKKKWADGLCFGGTMAWSIDFSNDNGAGSGDEPPETTDGSCGPNNGGAVCGSWPTGNCCSSSGWCGSGDDYCGNGCQSGECMTGGTTTDGTCGALFSGATCGGWESGDCCSASGWCGSSEDHCGAGCQSGSCKDAPTLGTGQVFISPDIVQIPSGGSSDDQDKIPVVSCYPPCTFILPPFSLAEPTTIYQDAMTVTIKEMPVADVTITITTIIVVPPLTTDVISVSNVVWTSTDTSIIYLWPSVSFPPVILTAKSTTVTKDSSTITIPPVIWTYSPEPGPPSKKTTPVVPVGFWASVKPKVPTSGGDSSGPKCLVPILCGGIYKRNCGGHGIDLGGGSSFSKCIGICGCVGPFCPSSSGGVGGGGNCVGGGCSTPAGLGGGGGDGDGEDPDEEESSSSCTATATVSDCLDYCSTTTLTGGRATETYFTRRCYETRSGCFVTGTVETTTLTKDSCPLDPAAPAYTPYWEGDTDMLVATMGDGGYGGYVVAAGTYTSPTSSFVPEQVTMTDLPTLTPDPTYTFPANCISTTTWTSCYFGSGDHDGCLSTSSCTETAKPTTTTKKTTITPIPTTAAAPQPISDTDGEWTYDCHGSAMCSQVQVNACDEAANNRLMRNNDLNYGTDGAPEGTGVCQSAFNPCGFFIEGHKEDGSACRFSGNQMWWDYQDIHEQRQGQVRQVRCQTVQEWMHGQD
ncbi:hypothetical protein V8F33_010342, partial [Rhypophila sp. PSN 637]